MILKYTDYNNSDKLFETVFAKEWKEIESSLSDMHPHLKLSDQAGKTGNYIFNPVGTNNAIKEKLKSRNWKSNIQIPSNFNFLGIDIDFGKKGIIIEVQFSNYPFLLNNVFRSELFFKAKTVFDNSPTEALVVITKAHMFPASNSTLYYEQAINQINELIRNNVFDIPIRVVGLFEEIDTEVDAVLTEYQEARYSRTVAGEVNIKCKFVVSRSNHRSTIEKIN